MNILNKLYEEYVKIFTDNGLKQCTFAAWKMNYQLQITRKLNEPSFKMIYER